MAVNPEVEAWLARYDNPQKSTLMAVREIILAADPRIGECIKWQSPTFTYNGNLASFNPRAKQFVSLMFHTGAQIPGEFPNLKGGAGTARYMQIESMEAAAELSNELKQIVLAWCELKADGKASDGTSRNERGRPARPSRGASKKTVGAKPSSRAAAAKGARAVAKEASPSAKDRAVRTATPRKPVSKAAAGKAVASTGAGSSKVRVNASAATAAGTASSAAKSTAAKSTAAKSTAAKSTAAKSTAKASATKAAATKAAATKAAAANVTASRAKGRAAGGNGKKTAAGSKRS